MPAQTVLIVDDTVPFVNAMRYRLNKEGFSVLVASDGYSTLKLLQAEKIDLIILNLTLPKVSGWDISLILRKKGSVPLILLTARDEISGQIIGSELGADDYILRPFNTATLLARTGALLKNKDNRQAVKPLLHVGDLVIDSDFHLVRRGDSMIDLTPTEFRLLTILAAEPGHIFSRDQIIDNLRKDSHVLYERTIDSHIMNLRKKIEPDPSHPRYVISIYGSGYKAGDRETEAHTI